jgi:hypothetical protein
MCYGTELTGMAIPRWAQVTRVEWHYIAPGKSQQRPSSKDSTGDCARVAERDPLRFALMRLSSDDLEGRLQHRSGHTAALGYLPPKSAFRECSGTGGCATSSSRGLRRVGEAL